MRAYFAVRSELVQENLDGKRFQRRQWHTTRSLAHLLAVARKAGALVAAATIDLRAVIHLDALPVCADCLPPQCELCPYPAGLRIPNDWCLRGGSVVPLVIGF